MPGVGIGGGGALAEDGADVGGEGDGEGVGDLALAELQRPPLYPPLDVGKGGGGDDDAADDEEVAEQDDDGREDDGVDRLRLAQRLPRLRSAAGARGVLGSVRGEENEPLHDAATLVLGDLGDDEDPDVEEDGDGDDGSGDLPVQMPTRQVHAPPLCGPVDDYEPAPESLILIRTRGRKSVTCRC